MALKNFKSLKGTHALKFREDVVNPQAYLRDTIAGDTFLREGAVCMRLQDSIMNNEFKAGVREGKVPIINLQTANVWPADNSDEITLIDAEVLVRKIYRTNSED